MIPSAVKILLVSLLSIELCYLNYLLFESLDFQADINESWVIKLSALAYFYIIFLFAQVHFKNKAYLTMTVWLFFNATIMINGVFYILETIPPLYFQYAFSSSLGVYGFLLLIKKGKFPDWMRIFAVVNLFLLLPCVYFYFQKNWEIYKFLVYVLSFTPIIKSLVFLELQSTIEEEVLDL